MPDGHGQVAGQVSTVGQVKNPDFSDPVPKAVATPPLPPPLFFPFFSIRYDTSYRSYAPTSFQQANKNDAGATGEATRAALKAAGVGTNAKSFASTTRLVSSNSLCDLSISFFLFLQLWVR